MSNVLGSWKIGTGNQCITLMYQSTHGNTKNRVVVPANVKQIIREKKSEICRLGKYGKKGKGYPPFPFSIYITFPFFKRDNSSSIRCIAGLHISIFKLKQHNMLAREDMSFFLTKTRLIYKGDIFTITSFQKLNFCPQIYQMSNMKDWFFSSSMFVICHIWIALVTNLAGEPRQRLRAGTLFLTCT